MSTNIERITSPDGTEIAIETAGEGRPVVLIGGAFNDRSTMSGLAQLLAPYCRPIAYDRRGRGESGDNSGDFSADREIEDLQAVIDHAGGTASIFGHSSGGVLALEAAIRGLPIEKVARCTTRRSFPRGRGPARLPTSSNDSLPSSEPEIAMGRRRCSRPR
jgi:pimeloyl-ACP methyl ester carboxylesterase